MAATRPPALPRRSFLHGAAGSALTLAAGGALAGCAQNPGLVETPTDAQLVSPENPATWPVNDDNPPIAGGLRPEQNATLRVYNWEDYLAPEVIEGFQKEYAAFNVEVDVQIYDSLEEGIERIRSGQDRFDLFVPTFDLLGGLVEEGLIRPLTQEYIPNIEQVWPAFRNPFYDREWRYSVPFTVYTIGVLWRADRVDEDISARANPYEVLWDPKYRGRVGIIDDMREAMSVILLKNGITDLNTDSDRHLQLVRDDLLLLAETMDPVITSVAFSDVPEGVVDIALTWSGDAIGAPGYFPEGEGTPEDLRYWSPVDGRGFITNDIATLLSGGRSPVLAHHFLNYLLNYEASLANMAFHGYQAPQTRIDPDLVVREDFIPEQLRTAVIRQEFLDVGYRPSGVPASISDKWQRVWDDFKKALES